MPKTIDTPILEVLEARIAPAGLFTYSDTDGDTVTVKLAGNGTVGGDASKIMLAGTDALSSMLTISVKKGVAGDGLAEIMEIEGTALKSILAAKVDLTGDGIDINGLLGKVTVHDLLNGADIKAGGTKADKTIVVAGHLSATSTIELGSVFSSLTALDADGDKYTIALRGDGGFQGSLADGLSLWNTTTKSALGITVTKDKISGDGLVDLKAITEGAGVTGLGAISAPLTTLTDNITLPTSVAKVTLGSIDQAMIDLGGTVADKAVFTAGHITDSDLHFDGKLVSFTAAHFESGTLTAAVITTLKIAGNTKAGLAGDLGATVEVGSIGTASVKGDLSGSIHAETTLGKVSIGDDVLGGATRGSGSILAGASIGSVTIGGDLQGGSGELSGVIFQYNGDFDADDVHTLINPGANAAVKTSAITVGGSVFGGTGDFSGGILVHNVKTLAIKQNLEGGDNVTNGDLRNTGFIYGTLINTLNIGGSILAGTNTGGGTLENSGAINVRSHVGALTVGVNITGSASHDATLASFGLVQQIATGSGIFDLKGNRFGFGKITVKGNVTNADILAGVDGMGFDNIATQTNNAMETGVPGDLATAKVNPFVGIGAVSIGGNMTNSTIAAGFAPGADGMFGTTDEVVGTAIPASSLYSGSPSSIASLVVNGALGAVNSVLSAAQYGKITVKPGAGLPTLGLTSPDPSLDHLNIIFDYTYDTSGFFNDAARRAVLDEAAALFEARLLASDFAGIVATGVNTWALEFPNPSLPAMNLTLTKPPLEAGTIVIYVGAQDSPGTQVAEATTGYSFFGTAQFAQLFNTRDSLTDYRSLGGTIWFDTETNWYFDNDATTMEMFTGMDFYTVAMHEIGHILGFSDAPKAYEALVSTVGADNFFTGPNAVALFGSPVPLKPGNDPDHFKEGVLFNGQRLAMDPIHSTGERDPFTELDWAVLKDLGYNVQPA